MFVKVTSLSEERNNLLASQHQQQATLADLQRKLGNYFIIGTVCTVTFSCICLYVCVCVSLGL